jgi:glucose/arabinose dehydrogenase
MCARMLLFVLVVVGCADATGASDEPGPQPGDTTVRLERIATGLTAPVHLASPAGDSRLFVVEQPGRVRVIREGQLLATPFLDITDRVTAGGERGLFSIAFHPAYSTNGIFFVNYTGGNGATRVERFRVSADPERADAGSATLVLTVAQPFSNHNGGQLAFGPDGMLYIGMGDGGSGGDPQNHGQNRGTLLGALLRIDVNGGDPYAVPADNPLVGTTGARPEIWAWGLRNPWRFSFDGPSGMIYIADVGQNQWEEVNAVPAAAGGLNYGWNIMEGRHCFGAAGCDTGGLTQPVLEYDHGQGCSVTGGYVYRGRRVPALAGHYFYADYCRGWVRSFRLAGGTVVDQREWAFGDLGNVLSFGRDADGELYVLSARSGTGSVHQIVR